MPNGFDRVFFSNSGAESVEAALKLARYHTKRKYFISFYGGFHGRTYGALSLTSSRVVHRAGFGPFLPVIHVPYPNPYRPLGFSTRTCDLDIIRFMKEVVFRAEVSPGEVAAIVVEPVQGEGGYIVPPVNFLCLLRELCDEHGILLIADEVQSGCFRTGKFLASEHSGIRPDIVCLAKAIGGGIPMGVTVASDEIMDWPPGTHASTFGGNNLACAAALAALNIMKRKGFAAHVRKEGAYLLRRLAALQKDHEIVGDVRGMGLMCGMELVKDRTTRETAHEERNAILNAAFERGVAFLPAGESVIRFCPPLTIGREDIGCGLEILEESIRTAGVPSGRHAAGRR
jgi:4-aminobutyrate aminotransferase